MRREGEKVSPQGQSFSRQTVAWRRGPLPAWVLVLFRAPLPLLPLLTIEAKSGVLLPGLHHVLLGAGNKEAFPTGLDYVDVVAKAAGNASLLPAPRRTWSRPGSKTPDFASIVSNGRSDIGAGIRTSTQAGSGPGLLATVWREKDRPCGA